LSIALTSINVRGVPTTIQSSTYTQTIKGKGKRTAVMAGGGTGAGALIGGLAGGGKGALIGGLVGAGAGTAGAAFTGNKELTIPAESVVTFRLGHSITVRRSAKQPSQNQPSQ
jgi:outer membrane lipoprotein SlyB